MQENSSFSSDSGQIAPATPEQKEKPKAFLLALGALGLAFVVSAIFFGLGMLTNNQVTAKTEQIATLKSQIKTLESDKKNSVASLIADGKLPPSIQLVKLLTDLKSVAAKYQVSFQNFSVQDDTITTNLIAKNDEKDAVQKIIAMMKEFAKTGQQGNFSLDPIFGVTGDRQTRTTPITFKIVPTKPATDTAAATGATQDNSVTPTK